MKLICVASRASSKIVTMGSNLFSCWSPNGQYLAFLNKGNNVIVFDAQASRQIKKVRFAYEVNELQWTANSDHLLIATAGSDVGNIDVLAFKNEDMTLIDTWTAHTSNCHSLKIDRDYRRMAVAGGDYNVSLWDLEDLVCHHNVAFE
jgi:WD40 repeat protein